MTSRVFQHIRSNVVAYVALFVALGGTSYAALKLPANSVGTRQIKNHSITPVKLDPSKTAAVVRFWAVVDFVPGSGERISSSRPRAQLTWDQSSATGSITWHRPISPSCVISATSGSGLISAFANPLRTNHAFVQFSMFSASGQRSPGLAYIAVLCPQP